jgi:LCP family protein required for cell wall assembly
MPDQTRPRGRRGLARHGRLRRRGPAGALVTIVASSLAVLLVSGASLAAIAVRDVTSSVSTVSLGNEAQVEDESIEAITGGANILLVGSDERADQSSATADTSIEGQRNDVTILVHLSQDHSQLTAVSIPRDTMVDLPACIGEDGTAYPAETYVQFNTSLENGGLSCTVATVEAMTGLTIPYAGKITFDGVIEMSNALGGVDVCVAEPISDRDTGLSLDAGTHSLQGGQALQFLRTRYGVGDGSDLARISSQQVFLSAMMRKIISGGTLGNVATLYKLASAALSNMQLSSTLSSPDTLVKLALALKDLQPADIVFVQYPVVDDPRNSAKVVPSTADAQLLNDALAADTPFTLGDAATGRGSEADPAAPAAPAPAPAETTAPSTATPGTGSTAEAPAPATAPGAPAVLPSTITGQSAAEATCSVGNG